MDGQPRSLPAVVGFHEPSTAKKEPVLAASLKPLDLVAPSPRARLPVAHRSALKDSLRSSGGGAAFGSHGHVSIATPTSSHADMDGSSTFYDKLEIQIDEPIGSLSMSPRLRDVCLGARKGLYVLDMENCYNPPLFLNHASAWEVADCQWSPHPDRSSWIASAAGHQTLIWNLDLISSSGGPIQHTLKGHSRSVTDINFAVFDHDMIATCSLDGWVKTWDLRTSGRRPATGYCGWHIAATQVKWNRQDPHSLASAHDNSIYVWDDRKGSVPVHKITAHNQRCYGLDWDRRVADKFVTCSLDKTVKFWSLNSPEEPLKVITTKSPVWRARHLPFGRGVLVLPQRSDNSMAIYTSAGDLVESFVGHSETPKEFVWRTKGGSDPTYDDREFQLISLGRDRSLRSWPISSETLTRTGHKHGDPIDVRMTRRGFGASHSYRTSSMSFGSLPSSDSKSPGFYQSSMTPNLTSVRSSTRLSGGSARRKSSTKSLEGHWLGDAMLGVSPLSGEKAGSTSTSADEDSNTYTRTSSGSGMAVTPAAKNTFMTRHGQKRPAADTTLAWMSKVSRIKDEPEQTGDNDSEDGAVGPTEVPSADKLQFRLGEEFAACGKAFSTRVSFEKMNVANRICSISCFSSVLGDGSTSFIRVRFNFPQRYPLRAPPSIELEKNDSLSLKQRAILLRGVREVANSYLKKKEPSLMPCMRFLLGEQESRTPMDRDNSSSEEEDAHQGQQTAARVYNVPLPRRCGAVFSPHDELICFFPHSRSLGSSTIQPLHPNSASADGSRMRSSSPSRSRNPHPQQQREAEGKRHMFFETFGALPATGYEVYNTDEESDEILRRPVKIAHQAASVQRDLSGSRSGHKETAPDFSTLVHIRSIGSTTPLRAFEVAPVLNASQPRESLQEQLLYSSVRMPAAQIVSMFLASLRSGSTPFQPSQDKLARTLLQECISTLLEERDVQNLGLLASCLEQMRRNCHTLTKKEGEDDKSQDMSTISKSLPRKISARNPFVRSLALDSLAAILGETRSKDASKNQLDSTTPRLSRRTSASTIGPLNTNAAELALARTVSRPRVRTRSSVTFEGVNSLPSSPVPLTTQRFGSANSLDLPKVRKRRVYIAEAKVHNQLWLDFDLATQLECFLLAFADLLHRWQHHQLRAQVLALTNSTFVKTFSDSCSLKLLSVCSTCTRDLDSDWCSKCNRSQKGILCSLCHRLVTGLTQTCAICGHGGHMKCYESFFELEAGCPAGCDCHCADGGLSGVFQLRKRNVWH